MDARQFQELLEVFNKNQRELLQQLHANTTIQQSQQQQQNTPSLQVIIPPFENYDGHKENFKLYRQRIENYLAMKGVFTNKTLCHQMLINSIGSKYFSLLVSLVAPKNIADLKYDELMHKLETHLCPKKNILVVQHRFLSTYQTEDQTIASYVALLRRDITECEFRSTCACNADISNVFLRAQFIRGLKDSTIREQLLQSEESDFETIMQKALSLEASKIDSREFHSKQTTNVADVSKVYSTSSNSSRRRNRSRYRSPKASTRTKSKINYTRLGIENLCIRCGRDNHKVKECLTNPNKLKCKACGKTGHVQKVCLKTLITASNTIHTKDDGDEKIYKLYGINKIVQINRNQGNNNEDDKYVVTVQVNGRRQTFEVDSGVKYTLIKKSQYDQLKIQTQVERSSIAFKSYTKNIVIPYGKVKVEVAYNNRISHEEMYVVPDEYDTLLGRIWIRNLNIILQDIDAQRLSQIHSIHTIHGKSIAAIIYNFQDVFTEKVGCVPNSEVTLQLRKNSKPVFYKEREVPFALRDRVEKELNALEESGIISKVERSDWGSPLVVIPKSDGGVRLCVDYKLGVNPQLVSANYPIRRIEEIFNSLKGSKYFCRLDLYKAYLHLKVDKSSSEIQTISTHRGTYRVNRLSFGIKTAPSEFNRIIENILSGLKKTMSYFDDIIVHGTTEAECKSNLIECLNRLREHDLHLNRSKCSFMRTQIEYLGHVVQYNKIAKSPTKIQAIVEMPRPSTVDDVRRFLGMVTYYSRFIPEMSSITYPLRQLLQKNKKFYWSSNCEAAFLKLKNIISSEQVLMPFDPELPVVVACDASPTGIAGVLSHTVNGNEHPIAFASRSLTSAERNYSQLDREALAIIFTINHFFMYLYGRKFQLISDNRPLTRIFHHHNKMPAMTSLRLLRYAEFLANFDYEIVYKKGSENTNVDCLSRATQCLEKASTDKIINEEVNQLCLVSVFEISSEAINADVLATETSKDPHLSNVITNLLNNSQEDGNYTLNNGIVFKGQRVVIPQNLQPQILQELHHTHCGITKMKQLARRYCYWKGIDRDIERKVRSCEACVQIQSRPTKAPLHQWDEPAENWDRIHIDYAGPFQNKFFLIVVDAKSRWVEVRISNEAPTTEISINLLSEIFTNHGFPIVMVSDNATIFTSDEFKEYCRKNGIFQKLIAPGHPSTNGLAERNVQTIKRKLKAMSAEHGSLQSKINAILQRYRATPLECGKSPAELYYNRRMRIRLDALKPIFKFESTKPIPGVRKISVGERVQVLHIKNNKTVWKTGTVLKKYGQLHYLVQLDDGYTLKRHIDQLKSTKVQSRKVHFSPAIENNSPSQTDNNCDQYYHQLFLQNQIYPVLPGIQEPPQDLQEDQRVRNNQLPQGNEMQAVRRSERSRKKPTYLEEYLVE